MTAVFRIGKDGNGTAYAGRSEKEINDLVRQYKKCGWKVTYITENKDAGQVWYQLD